MSIGLKMYTAIELLEGIGRGHLKFWSEHLFRHMREERMASA